MDNVVLNKIAIIENCLRRIREEYEGHETELDFNYTKQDSIILNLQRCCEASIDIGMRIVRLKKLGLPQAGRDVFSFLEQSKILSPNISHKMEAMVGFRNVAVHDYQKLNLNIVKSILAHHLVDFQVFINEIRQSLI